MDTRIRTYGNGISPRNISERKELDFTTIFSIGKKLNFKKEGIRRLYATNK